jgi:thioredoxin reductase (NADPH)
MEVYDVIIVGAGPAGLTAAIYAARYKLKVLVLGKLHGGLISEAHEVCNFPSYGRIKGFELAMKMVDQVKALGVNISQELVNSIEKEENYFILKANKEYKTKKVILCLGTERKKLDVKGEKDFLSRGVSYCATCDSAFYKNKIAGVVGGSDAALTAALLLSEYANKVYIIYRKEKFTRAEPAWIELVENNPKIEKIFNANVIEIFGDKNVKGIKLDNKKEINLDGVFIEIGSSPDDRLPKLLNLELDNGFIRVNKKQETNVKGIFAAGDITDNPLKQVITACGEGAIAAFSAYEEIKIEEAEQK